MTFFINDPDGAHADQAIRDLPHNMRYRAFNENLWARYFLKDGKIHFHQRFWEMYLFCALEDRGTSVQKTMGGQNGGPDFSLKIGATKYWIEATAPKAGNKDDRVPFPVKGAANYVPRELILLRYTNALDTKFGKWFEWIEKKVVSSDDGYIIAINGLGIPDATCGFEYPYIIQSLYPVGPSRSMSTEHL